MASRRSSTRSMLKHTCSYQTTHKLSSKQQHIHIHIVVRLCSSVIFKCNFFHCTSQNPIWLLFRVFNNNILESATLTLFRFYDTQVITTVTGVLQRAMRTMDPSAATLGNTSTSDSSTGDDVSNTVVPGALAPDVMSDQTATAASEMAPATAAALQRRG